MELIKRDSILWFYLTDDIKDLIETGEIILQFVHEHKGEASISDYSFCVFPFAKAYEGFLKKLFLDMGLIKEHEYYGDEIRIGRLLSPQFMHDKNNVFKRVCKDSDELAEKLWNVWKRGRNLVFHYFPHNFRKIEYSEVLDIVEAIIEVMADATTSCIHDRPKEIEKIEKLV